VSERVLLDFPWIRETLQKTCSDDNPESQKKENLSYTKPLSKHKQESNKSEMLERTPDSDRYHVTNAARICIEKKSRGFSHSLNH